MIQTITPHWIEKLDKWLIKIFLWGNDWDDD